MNSRDSELVLLNRMKAGDTAAFRTIVERYKDLSLSLAISILHNKEEAEDVLQEVFIKVFNSIHQFRSNASFATWLYRIVVNTCLNANERNKQPLRSGLPAYVEAAPANSADPLLGNERKAFVLAGLGMIKGEEALLLRLYYLCDLKVSEIREITGLRESNIKVILYRGRKNLLEALTTIMGDEIKNLL